MNFLMLIFDYAVWFEFRIVFDSLCVCDTLQRKSLSSRVDASLENSEVPNRLVLLDSLHVGCICCIFFLPSSLVQ